MTGTWTDLIEREEAGLHEMTPDGRSEVILAQISDEPLSVDRVVGAVRDPRCGAVVVFIGLVRDHDHGRPVTVLEYSAHPSAGQVAVAVADEVGRQDGRGGETVRIAVEHRVGRLEVGDIAVVVAVAAEHRGVAFSACRTLIDRFKAEVPVWKHQVFTDGQDEWVGVP